MIERTDRDGVAILRLNHGKASALDIELCEEMQRQLAALAASDARAVIVTGTGSIFSAGVDLFRLLAEGEPYVRRFFPAMVSAFTEFCLFPRPVIAAVNGHAIAGGCILTNAADLRLMSSGKIGVPELLVGVPFPAIALEIARFGIPQAHLEEMIYTGMTVTAEEALARGVVDQVVPADALLDRAFALADAAGHIPRDSFRFTKQQLRSPYVAAAKALADHDRDVLASWSSPDVHAGIRRYLDRTVGKK